MAHELCSDCLLKYMSTDRDKTIELCAACWDLVMKWSNCPCYCHKPSEDPA